MTYIRRPLYHVGHINEAVDYLHSAISNVFEEVVPFNNSNKHANYPVWFSVETMSLNKFENKNHKMYKKTNKQLYFGLFYNYRKIVLKNSECDLINYRKSIQNVIKHNPSSVWPFVKRRVSYQPATFSSMVP